VIIRLMTFSLRVNRLRETGVFYFTGDNVTDIDWILEDSLNVLAKTTQDDPAAVSALVQAEYFKRLHSQIEAQVLMPYDLTLQDFKALMRVF